MRLVSLALLAVFAAVAVWLWGFGGADRVAAWAFDMQRSAQNAMAAALRELRGGSAGAVGTLWALCFTYGFVHAAGPGHGKLLIGGYGVGSKVTARRLIGLALASSLAQAAMAVFFVYTAVLALQWSWDQAAGAADRFVAPVSYGLIALVGLWLLWRGIRSLRPKVSHDHHHHEGGHCHTCGHAHGPTPEQAAAVSGWKDALAVISAIAIRPCTGAIFLLILTWRLDLDWAGIIGAFVMGLGTACLTIVVAIAAVSARESALAQVAGASTTARVMAAAQILAGGIIAVLAVQLMLRVMPL